MSYDDVMLVTTDDGRVVSVELGDLCDMAIAAAGAGVSVLSVEDKARVVFMMEWNRSTEHMQPIVCRFALLADIEREWGGAAPLTLATIYRALQAGQTPVVFDDGIAAPRGDGMSVCTVESYLGTADAPWAAQS